MTDSTLARSRGKAASKSNSSSKDFPLKIHKGRGYWCKKVRGVLHYFGKVSDDPKGEAALAKWLVEKDDHFAKRTPRSKDGLTVEDLADHFVNAKRPYVASGELTKRMFDEYYNTCQRIIKTFGAKRLVEDLGPNDFAKLRESAAKKWGLHRVAGEVQRVRTMFKFGIEQDLIKHVVKFGQTFKKPSKKVMRRARAAKGPRSFAAAEVRQLLKAAGVQMKAMILLGINCGFGNADCGQLPIHAVDLQGGWIDFPRPKTGIDRRCPLWPETVKRLKAVLAKRKEPKDNAHKGLLFITKYGDSWFKEAADNPVTKEFRKLLDSLKLHSPGKGFYTLRHTFETEGGAARDQIAVDAVMGHVDGSMAATYRERIDDERLVAVANHVRRWLFAKEGGAK